MLRWIHSLDASLDWLPYGIGVILAGGSRWSPLGHTISVRCEDSCDEQVVGRRLTGVVRAFDPDRLGQPLLIHLDQTVSYRPRVDAPPRHTDFVVVLAALRWHGVHRLAFTWAAVRVVDANAFADPIDYSWTIGVGRMML